MIVLEAKEIDKNYQNQDYEVPVLKKVSLAFSDHEFCGIVGPSGSGKTTLLYVLSGLEKASKGDVYIFNQNWNHLSENETLCIRKQDISFIFQFYNLLPNLTVYENIEVAWIIAENKDLKRIDDVLDWVGMAKYRDFFPNQLSGGMQQRVAIARALVNRPKIIFADEPTGNLDFQSGLDIMNLLTELYHSQKITIIMVTHNLDNLAFCTRKIKLLDGMVQSDESLSL